MTGRLAEIEARVNRATEGPWEAWPDGALMTVADWQGTVGRFHRGGGAADAEFVAHAREDVPYLLARVRELEAALRAESEMRHWMERMPSRTYPEGSSLWKRWALSSPALLVPAEKEER